MACGQVISAPAFCFLLCEMRGLGQAPSLFTKHLRALAARCSPWHCRRTSTTLHIRRKSQESSPGLLSPNPPVFSIITPGLLTLSLGSLPTRRSDSLPLGRRFPGLTTPQATQDHRFEPEQACQGPGARQCHASHMTGLVTACLQALGLGNGDKSPAEPGTHSAPPFPTCPHSLLLPVHPSPGPAPRPELPLHSGLARGTC